MAQHIPGTVYLVGGAVRDKLLGRTVKERDWVVVGSSPDEMLAAGFKVVGADFPVFLHPKTKEEYALARTERKTGTGYLGFETDTKGVSIEDDLKRRDITINAIAENENGERTDPYGGERDLNERRLRHVSDAFSEDPLRVLRVARFLSQLAEYKFHIADDTLELLRAMSAGDELKALTGERVWLEIQKACRTSAPSLFFTCLADIGAWDKIAPNERAVFHSERIALVDKAARVFKSTKEKTVGVVTALAAIAVEYGIELNPWLRSLGAAKDYLKPAKATFDALNCFVEDLPKQDRLTPERLLEILTRCNALRDARLLRPLLDVWRIVPLSAIGADKHDAALRQLQDASNALHSLKPAEITAGLEGEAAGNAMRAAQIKCLQEISS